MMDILYALGVISVISLVCAGFHLKRKGPHTNKKARQLSRSRIAKNSDAAGGFITPPKHPIRRKHWRGATQ